MRDVSIELEPWPSLAVEAEALGAAHFEEVNFGVEPRRRYKLDISLMQIGHAHGSLKIISARKLGKLIGYLTFTVCFDPESQGLLVANQGAWFVAPVQGRAGVALAMWEKSIEVLRAMGVCLVEPHHHLQGRGANLGRFFRRRGATLTKQVYSLWIGPEAA